MEQLMYIIFAAVVAIAVLILTRSLKKQVDKNLNIINEIEDKHKNRTLK